jgi:hypothetical protein
MEDEDAAMAAEGTEGTRLTVKEAVVLNASKTVRSVGWEVTRHTDAPQASQ